MLPIKYVNLIQTLSKNHALFSIISSFTVSMSKGVLTFSLEFIINGSWFSSINLKVSILIVFSISLSGDNINVVKGTSSSIISSSRFLMFSVRIHYKV